MSKRKWCPLCGQANRMVLHTKITSANIHALPEILNACETLITDWDAGKPVIDAVTELKRVIAKTRGNA